MSTDRVVPDPKQRNPIAHEAHRRQAFWQIYFPLIIVGVLVIVAIVLSILTNDQGASKWSDISLIYMIALAMIAFLITTIILVVSVYYLGKLLKSTPYFFFNLHRYFYVAELRVKDVSNVIAEPFLRIRSFIAGVRALGRK